MNGTDLRTIGEHARIRLIVSRSIREALELPAAAPWWPYIDLSGWALSQLDPEDALRNAAEWEAHLNERLRDGEFREARVDRHRLVRHALWRAASQRLRQPRRSTTRDAGALVELHNRTVRYLLTAGQRRRAVCVARHAVTVAERYLDDQHLTALMSRIQLADALQWAGDTDAALERAAHVREDCERLLGPEHELTVTACAQQALSYQWAGCNVKAIAINEQVIAERTKHLGAAHPDTLRARGRLAWSYGEAGHYPESVDMKKELLELHVQQLGPDHLDTLTSRGSLAMSLRLAGRHDEAMSHLEAILPLRERLCGPRHPDTLWTHANLGKCFELVGRVSEAVTELEAVVSLCADVLGPEHHDTLMYRTYLSSAYQTGAKLPNRVGQGLDEAIRIIDDVVPIRARLHPDHPDSLDARAQQARAYNDAGQSATAIKIMQQLIPAAERVRGADHPLTSGARDTLATWLRQTEEQ